MELLASKTILEDISNETPEEKQLRRKLYSEAGVDLDSCLTRLDYKKEYEWIDSVFKRMTFKEGLVHFDTNYLNILVREDKDVEQENKIVIIDYELSYIGPRVFDIARVWVNRMITWNDKKNKVNGHDFPGIQERELFVNEYLEEIKRLDPDNFNSDGLDEREHVMKEADFAVLSITLGGSLMLLKMLKVFEREPAFLTYIPFAQEMYLKMKQEYLGKYPDWNSSTSTTFNKSL